jgi:hypothetical protein
MFSNYIHKILNSNSTNVKENETKLAILSTNTLETKRISTNPSKIKSQDNLENDSSEKDNHKLLSNETTLITKRKSILSKNINEYNAATCNTNTFTTTNTSKKLTNRLSNLNAINLVNNDHNNKNEFNTNSYTHKYIIGEKTKTESENSNHKKEMNLNINHSNGQNVYPVYPSKATSRISDQIKILNNIRSNSAGGVKRSNQYMFII